MTSAATRIAEPVNLLFTREAIIAQLNAVKAKLLLTCAIECGESVTVASVCCASASEAHSIRTRSTACFIDAPAVGGCPGHAA